MSVPTFAHFVLGVCGSSVRFLWKNTEEQTLLCTCPKPAVWDLNICAYDS